MVNNLVTVVPKDEKLSTGNGPVYRVGFKYAEPTEKGCGYMNVGHK